MDYASIVKDRVSTPELFEHYGFRRDRGGFVCCPFHDEKTGSMKVYDGDRGYHCFGGCGAHGDIISFVQNYFKISFKDALIKINDDFRLGLPLNGSIDGELRRKIQRESDERIRKRDAVKKERERLYKAREDALYEWIRLDLQRIENAPKTPSEPLNEKFIEALQNLEYTAHILEEAEAAIYQFEHELK